jgi:DNA/RNA-binding domain of Phe-tRNA-synthetase-like protein
MTYNVQIDPQVYDKFHKYEALIIYAEGLENQPSTEESIELLRMAEKKQRSIFGDEKSSSHPYIIPWREAYKSFGAKPNKYLCSTEAILSRVLKGDEIPPINYLVDSYNAISLEYLLPIGGEDWDCLTSDLNLTIATGQEEFSIYQRGELVVENPNPGEVIWMDSTGVTCRRFNWRQCHRTQLTVNTRNAYFVLDRLPPYPMENLVAAGDKLMEILKNLSPSCVIHHELLRYNHLASQS